MRCKPGPDGNVYIYGLGITTFPEAVGTHDASDSRITCDVTAGGCSGVGTVIVTFATDATAQEISLFGADAKSGTFTLDEFTTDGHVSGSMDLMMTEAAPPFESTAVSRRPSTTAARSAA